MDDLVSSLKAYNDKLLSFYVAETKSVLTKEQMDRLSNIKILVDNSSEIYYEVVGRYDLRGIIEELEKLIGDNDFAEAGETLQSLLSLLRQLYETEYPYLPVDDNKPFTMQNSPYYISEEYKGLVSYTEEQLNDIFASLKEMSCEETLPPKIKKIVDDILFNILTKVRSRRRLSALLGYFNESDFTITLYVGAIKSWLKPVEFFKKALDVYSHELFHAFHYVHLADTENWTYEDKSRIVKESLARFVEFKYGLFHIESTEISAELIRLWNDYDMLDFPYAGAKYVGATSGLCEQMFKESCFFGPKDAYHLIETAAILYFDEIFDTLEQK